MTQQSTETQKAWSKESNRASKDSALQAIVALVHVNKDQWAERGLPTLRLVSDAEIPERPLVDPGLQEAYAKAVEKKQRRLALRALHQACDVREVDHSIDRGGAHEAPSPGDGDPIWDASRRIYPEDFYSWRMSEYGSHSEFDHDGFAVFQRIDGRPNMSVTVYRSVEEEGAKQIRAGDWVTPSRRYAVEHADSNISGKARILSMTVRARDLYTDGNSVLEWGYHPQEFRPEFPQPGQRDWSLQERVDVRLPWMERGAHAGAVVAIDPACEQMALFVDKLQSGQEPFAFLGALLSMRGMRTIAVSDLRELVEQVEGWADHAPSTLERIVHDSLAAPPQSCVNDSAEQLYEKFCRTFGLMLKHASAGAPVDGAARAWQRNVVAVTRKITERLIGNDLIDLDDGIVFALASALAQHDNWFGLISAPSSQLDSCPASGAQKEFFDTVQPPVHAREIEGLSM